MSRLTLLLPERRRLAGQRISPDVAKALARADREHYAASDESAQLRRYFTLPDHRWPLAALTRQLDVGDAGSALWLRADPVRVQPELTGVRLMVWGELGLNAPSAQTLVALLQPLFAEQGWQLSAPHPQRWYVRMPVDVVLPDFAPPERVLGDDLFEHLPQGATGRLWRALLNEAQILLHQHGEAGGSRAANSLWFWGGGCLPERVCGHVDALESDEADLRALALVAEAGEGSMGHRLIDLRDIRDWPAIEVNHLRPVLKGQVGADIARLTLDFADGCVVVIQPSHRWRFWRRSVTTLT